jgi:hypothetical protein
MTEGEKQGLKGKIMMLLTGTFSMPAGEQQKFLQEIMRDVERKFASRMMRENEPMAEVVDEPVSAA